jgi:hypothetical protein
MKYSDDSKEHRETNIGYTNERWRQLYSVQSDWATEGIKYLMLVNSGGAVAMLAFLGSVAKARDLSWPKATFGFFALGIVLIGFLHVLRHYHISQLFKKWRESVNEYFTDQKAWNKILEEDLKRSSKYDWALLLAYISFGCFITGIAIGIFNFTDLTSGDDHGNKETRITCAYPQANCPKATYDYQDISSRGSGDKGDAKQPTASTNSKKEIK